VSTEPTDKSASENPASATSASETASKTESGATEPASTSLPAGSSEIEPPGVLRRIGRGVFGQVSWQPPPWLAAIFGGLSRGGRWLGAHKSASAVLFVALIALGGGVYFGNRWLEKQPKPIEMSVRVDPPEATKLEENAKPDTLRVLFGGSAAPIERVKKPVTFGVELTPPLQGSWRWDSDRVLTFVPQRGLARR
jgi:hypothetical protein